MTAVSGKDCVFASRFTLRSWMGRTDPLARTLEILGNAVAHDCADAPPLAFDRPASRPAGRLEGMSWDVDGGRTAWMGELWWRHPHAMRRRVACTTHVVITEVVQQVHLTVRVYVDGGVDELGGLVGAGQARPSWLSTLARDCQLSAAWGNATPRLLTNEGIDAFVRDVLFDDDRTWPVVVLSAREHGGYIIPPETLSDQLFGLAPVYYLDTHRTSYSLTDQLGGRELSCYWGAARTYLPKFSCADDPSEHFLLLPDDLLDPALRAELVGELAVGTRDGVPVVDGIEARRQRQARRSHVTPPLGTSIDALTKPQVRIGAGADGGGAEEAASTLVTAMKTSVEAPASGPATDGMGVVGTGEIAGAIGEIAKQLGILAASISKLAAANRELSEEVTQLRTGHAVRLASIATIERRIERIDSFVLERLPALLAPQGADAPAASAESDRDRVELVDVVRQSSARHADALLLLESAEQSALESPYEDVDRVAKVLDAMAEIARRRQAGTLGMPVRQAFRDYGIDYRTAIAETTPERQRAQYLLADDHGRTYECLEHVVLGSTYDPRYCLRIYFTSRAPTEPRFVIGHVGRHFKVITST